MARIYIDLDRTVSSYELPERYWFDAAAAEYWRGDKDFNGSNNVDVNTGDSARGQGLYRTAGGRWVLHNWSSWQGESDHYRYVDPEGARGWLAFNGYDEEVEKYFGPIEDEHGPEETVDGASDA